MKKPILLASLLLISCIAFSQIVTENVNFDNYVSTTDNDLKNFFVPSSGSTNFLTASATGGITGGSIVPPDYESWGNDVFYYCPTYRVMLDSLMETSICFKYNSTLINPNSYDRSATINMNGADGYFYTERDNRITFACNSSIQNSDYFTPVDGNWYKLVGRTKLLSYGTNQVFMEAELFDLGASGTATPNSIAIITDTVTDPNLWDNSSFNISIEGAKWGGAELMDNFTFKGIKNSYSMCELSTHGPVTVDFDNYSSSTNNDLLNKFSTSGTAIYTQFSNNGITGGVVIPPNTVNWANDMQRYCASYTNTSAETYETSICFKYNASIVNNVNYDRTVSIWLHSDRLFFYLNNDRTLTINTHAAVPSSAPLNLISGRWYKFFTQYKPIGGLFDDEFFAKIVVYDLGSNGQDLPLPVDSLSGTFYDVNMLNTTELLMEFTGAKYGGAEYLDDFNVNGTVASSSNCVLSSVANKIIPKKELTAYPNPTNDLIYLDHKNLTENIFQIKITNSLGKQVFFEAVQEKQLNLNQITNGTKGIYFLQVLNTKGDVIDTQKIILE